MKTWIKIGVFVICCYLTGFYGDGTTNFAKGTAIAAGMLAFILIISAIFDSLEAL